MKKIALFLLISIFSVIHVFWYDLTDDDNNLLDSIEEKIMTIIDDSSNNISAELFVDYVYRVLDTRDLSERQWVLLDIIADDISWEYEIGEYSYDDTWEAMTEEDCYEDEYYDEQDKMCYFQEDENYDDDIVYQVWELDWNHHQEDQDSQVLAKYSVLWDTITLTEGEEDIKNQEIWNIFTALIPISVRGDIVEYHISNDINSDTAAHVEQTAEDNTKWLMGVNIAAFYIDGILEPQESYATLIHEFAHVLTLNTTQVRYYPVTENEFLLQRFAENCDGNLLQEWCLKTTAYLDDFIDTFWSDSEYLEKVRNEEVYAYDDFPNSFITDYAATNPWEDIAESFTYFVINPRPSWNTIADKKLLFFYDYNELISLRKEIRTNLADLK